MCQFYICMCMCALAWKRVGCKKSKSKSENVGRDGSSTIGSRLLVRDHATLEPSRRHAELELVATWERHVGVDTTPPPPHAPNAILFFFGLLLELVSHIIAHTVRDRPTMRWPFVVFGTNIRTPASCKCRNITLIVCAHHEWEHLVWAKQFRFSQKV